MAKLAKFLQGVAGAAGGAVLNIEDVFSTYLYEGAAVGSGDIQIQNGVDLDGEGGLVWTKGRSLTTNHFLTDTERGGTKSVFSNLTNAEATNANLMSFNSDGFTLGSGAVGWSAIAGNGEEYASWTFRKAPKFFDVVTYTGDGTAGRTVSHNLGSVPGCIIVKRTSNTQNWKVYHRGMDATAPEDYSMQLDQTSARVDDNNIWHDTAPTSTVFTVGSQSRVNANGETYVAYLFAHNDGDGEFGPNGDQDIIKCGSFTTDASGSVTVDLGFEPQFLVVKNTQLAENWVLLDNMRGWSFSSQQRLFPNLSNAEQSLAGNYGTPTATGFNFVNGLGNSNTYIYIAIRRGPMAVPESATDVFDVIARSGTGANATITSDVRPDTVLIKHRSGRTSWFLTPRVFSTNSSASSKGFKWDLNGTQSLLDGVPIHSFTNTTYSLTSDGDQNGSGDTYIDYIFKRAPAFFDYCTYDGDGTSSQTVPHGLTVVPEMICTSFRTNTSGNTARRFFYHKDLGNTSGLWMDDTVAERTGEAYWASTTPTESNFYVGGANSTNCSGDTYFAILFASIAGVCKVGSVSHTLGSNTDVDCGFSAGARFVLLKITSSSGHWVVVDTERGIVTGDDPYVLLSTDLAEVVSTDDVVDPYSSGFSIGPDLATGNYIYYAIA